MLLKLKQFKMQLTINGDDIQTEKQNIAALVAELNLPQTGIAIAINEEVISKSNWLTYQLTEYDKILIITATQGG